MLSKKDLLSRNKEEEKEYLTKESLSEILDLWMMENEEAMTLRIQEGVEEILRRRELELQQMKEDAEKAAEEMFIRTESQPFWWTMK